VIARAAIDLREGACVQLVGGSYAEERVRVADPVAVAKGWRACGLTALHLVDLDAATGRGTNGGVIEEILTLPGLDTQVGGGVRDDAAIARWLALGATRVVVGTRALEDPGWCARAAERHPRRLVVAVDLLKGRVVTRGWREEHPETLEEVLRRLDALPLAGVLVTVVDVEGREAGPDLGRLRAAAGATRHPLVASGGIASLEDLRAVAAAGAVEAVLGMALYTGTLNARDVAREFGR
jgi:phosphoribosyl isomerase A